MQNEFFYGKDKLTVQTAILLVQKKIKGSLHPETIEKIRESQKYVQQMVDTGKTIYGITTGFGILANTKISQEEIARLMLITKVHALAQGFSGVQLSTIERLLWHLENDVIPVVPEKGSVGASGDLAPLAHLCLPLIGLGEVLHKGKKRKTYEVLSELNLSPIQLGPKEGLALINGTQ